jgi:cytoskeletal protein RodZ
MSLINDALKRASQAQKQQPKSDEPAGGPPMQPVETPPPGSSGLPFLLPIIVVVIFLGAGWWLVQTWRGREKSQTTASETSAQKVAAQNSATPSAVPVPDTSKTRIQINTNIVSRPPPSSAPATKPTATVPTAPPEKRPAAIVAENKAPPTGTSTPTTVATTPPTPTPSTAAAPTPAAPATFPALKLQAIFYRLRNATAIINGKTVATGESIDGARVTEIERLAVTLDWNGEKHTLKLE